MKQKVNDGYNINPDMNKEYVEIWKENYWKNKKVNLYKYFNPKNKKILEKLEITIMDKLYTEREVELFEASIIKYYSEEDSNKMLMEKGVTLKDYKKILKVLKKIINKYEL